MATHLGGYKFRVLMKPVYTGKMQFLHVPDGLSEVKHTGRTIYMAQLQTLYAYIMHID